MHILGHSAEKYMTGVYVFYIYTYTYVSNNFKNLNPSYIHIKSATKSLSSGINIKTV